MATCLAALHEPVSDLLPMLSSTLLQVSPAKGEHSGIGFKADFAPQRDALVQRSTEHGDSAVPGWLSPALAGVCLIATMILTIRELQSRTKSKVTPPKRLVAMEDKTEPFISSLFPPSGGLLPNVLAGMLLGLKLVVGMVVFASVAFNTSADPEINALFATGINVNFMSCIVGLLLSATLSDSRILIAPQDVPAIIMGQIAMNLPGMVHDKSNVGPTLLALVWINTLFYALLSFLFCAVGMDRLVRRIPSPIKHGFLAAIGAMAIRTALSILTGVKFLVVWPVDLEPFSQSRLWTHVFYGFFTLLCYRYAADFIQPRVPTSVKLLVKPFCLLLPLLTFYIVIFCRGHIHEDLAHLREIVWLYPLRPTQPFYRIFPEIFQFSRIEWSTLCSGEVLTECIVMQLLSALAAQLSLLGGAASMPGDTEMSITKELKLLGLINLVVGGMGGSLCYHQLGISVNLFKDGGSHKVSAYVAVAFVSIVFFVGVPVSPFVPKFYLAGIFLNLGLTFLTPNFLDQRDVPWSAWVAEAGIVAVALVRDLDCAVELGIALCVVSLLIILSSTDPVGEAFGSDLRMSSQLRTNEERKVLCAANKVHVIQLLGPIFFGSIMSVEDTFRDLMDSVDTQGLHVIIDLENITMLETTAMETLRAMGASLSKRGGTLHFGGAPEWHWMLKLEGLVADEQGGKGAPKAFASVDDAMRECEDMVLENSDTTMKIVQMRTSASSATGAVDALSLSQLLDVEASTWEDIKKYSTEITPPVGSVIFQAGDPCEAICLLLAGRIELEATTHTSTALPLSVLGAKAMFLAVDNYVMTARVVSESGATLLRLSRENLRRMREKAPHVYTALIDMVILPELAEQ